MLDAGELGSMEVGTACVFMPRLPPPSRANTPRDTPSRRGDRYRVGVLSLVAALAIVPPASTTRSRRRRSRPARSGLAKDRRTSAPILDAVALRDQLVEPAPPGTATAGASNDDEASESGIVKPCAFISGGMRSRRRANTARTHLNERRLDLQPRSFGRPGQIIHSILIDCSRTTLRHFASSLRRTRRMSSGGSKVMVRPSLAARLWKSSVSVARRRAS